MFVYKGIVTDIYTKPKTKLMYLTGACQYHLSNVALLLQEMIKASLSFTFFSSQLKTTFSTDSRVQNMFDILLNEEMEKDKREKVGIFCNLKKNLVNELTSHF